MASIKMFVNVGDQILHGLDWLEATHYSLNIRGKEMVVQPTCGSATREHNDKGMQQKTTQYIQKNVDDEQQNIQMAQLSTPQSA